MTVEWGYLKEHQLSAPDGGSFTWIPLKAEINHLLKTASAHPSPTPTESSNTTFVQKEKENSFVLRIGFEGAYISISFPLFWNQVEATQV